MLFLFAALAGSFAVTLLLIRFEHTHRTYSVDRAVDWSGKVQHHAATRIGGAGVIAGLLIAWLLRLADDVAFAGLGLGLLACAVPAFAAGLLEDLTKRGWTKLRFAATLLSAALGGVLAGGWVTRIDIAVVDPWIAIPAASILFTCLAVAGVTNAINLIDGFNGLASGVVTIILLGISFVAFKNGDALILAAAITGIGAILGFMLWNFPRGLIYLGDGGAYLIGFWTAELSVLLVVRNPQVSAWFPLILCSYPVFETLFTIYRRVVMRGVHPVRPDAAHLHHMIYKRLVRWAIGGQSVSHTARGNALTSPYLWLLTSVAVVPAVLLWGNTAALQVCAVMFSVLYIYGYSTIVRFRAPKWWRLKRSAGPSGGLKRGG